MNRAGHRTRFAALFATLVGCAPAEPEPAAETAQAARVTTSGLTGVVGAWSDTTIDTPAVLVNGERWSGTHPRPELEQSSRRFFGGVNDTLITNATAPGAFPFAVAGDVESFTAGTLRVEFNMIGGKSDQIAGLIFGLRPSGEYFYVRYNTKDGNVALWRFADGERTVIKHGEVHKQIPLGTWHELVVQVDANHVRGHIAGDTTISVEHTLDAAPAGRVGVWAKRDAITAFRSFSATP
jgi:hypothetical protein